MPGADGEGPRSSGLTNREPSGLSRDECRAPRGDTRREAVKRVVAVGLAETNFQVELDSQCSIDL